VLDYIQVFSNKLFLRTYSNPLKKACLSCCAP